MDCQSDHAITRRLRDVKDLYAELFALLVESIAEDPLEQAVGGVDRSIESLMGSIESHMDDLRREIQQAGGDGGPDPSIGRATNEFEAQLRDGLGLMARRVRERSEELAATRENIKERLRLVQLKGRGARGYRRPDTASEALVESRV